MNTEQTLNSKEIYSFGFKNAKKYFWSFFAVIVVYLLLSALGPDEKNKNPMTILQGFGALISFVGTLYLGMSVTGTILKISRGEQVTMKTFFTWPVNGFKSLWAGIVSALILLPIFLIQMASIMFFVIAGIKIHSLAMIIIGSIVSLAIFIILIYFLVRVVFAKFYALENGSWAMASIKESFNATKGKVGRLVILTVISIGIAILGFIALFIGLLWAIPTVLIAQVYIYTLLFPKQNNNSNTTIEVQPTEIPAHLQNNEQVNEQIVENNINNTNI